MDWKEKFQFWLQSEEPLNPEHLQELKEVVRHYPYFQAAHFLLCRELHRTNSLDFEEALNRCAIRTVDRKILFEAFNKPAAKQPKSVADIKALGLSGFSLKGAIEAAGEDDALYIEEGRTFVPESSAAYRLEDNYQAESDPTTKSKDPEDTISAFVKSQQERRKRKLTSASRSNEPGPDSSLQAPDDLVSETLAKIYVKQEKFREAIDLYERLSLLEPEKKAYFARHINELKKKL